MNEWSLFHCCCGEFERVFNKKNNIQKLEATASDKCSV